MSPESPWYAISQLASLPFPYCGKIGNGWIADPFDTWSSLIYPLVTLWILKRHKTNSYTFMIAITPLFLAIGSILFHMSFPKDCNQQRQSDRLNLSIL